MPRIKVAGEGRSMFKSRKVYLRPVEKAIWRALQSRSNEDIRYMTGTTREYTMEDLYEHYERITSDETRYDLPSA
ncbi:hypothetical protein PO124_03505 [Bacillus licheniformis]|nr:hypothetical protein [Bacillus licheniformis]